MCSFKYTLDQKIKQKIKKIVPSYSINNFFVEEEAYIHEDSVEQHKRICIQGSDRDRSTQFSASLRNLTWLGSGPETQLAAS